MAGSEEQASRHPSSLPSRCTALFAASPARAPCPVPYRFVPPAALCGTSGPGVCLSLLVSC